MGFVIRTIDRITTRAPSWVQAGARRAVVAGIYAFASYVATGASGAPSWVAPLLAALGLGASKARRSK